MSPWKISLTEKGLRLLTSPLSPILTVPPLSTLARAGAAAAAGEEAGAAGAAAAGDEAGAGAAAAGDEAGAAAGAEVACAAGGFELAGPGACADPQAASAGSSNARAARQGISGYRKGEWWRRWDRMETSSSSSN